FRSARLVRWGTLLPFARRVGVNPFQDSVAHQGGLAEQALDEVHGQLGGTVAGVQHGVELDDVQRAHASGVGDHLHHQLRLAVVHPARYRGAHTGGDARVEEVDIEAHV